MIFIIPGCMNVVRVNGHELLTDDAGLRARFEADGKTLKIVIVTTIN